MREFPRLLYIGDGSRFNRRVVADEAEFDAALLDGWREAKFPLPTDEPPKRKPGRPKKESV